MPYIRFRLYGDILPINTLGEIDVDLDVTLVILKIRSKLKRFSVIFLDLFSKVYMNNCRILPQWSLLLNCL